MGRSLYPLTVLVRWLLGIAVVAVICLATAAFAQVSCVPLETGVAALERKYGELPEFTAGISNGNLLLITIGPDGGWTLLVVRPDGMACPIAAGTGWESARPKPKGDPA